MTRRDRHDIVCHLGGDGLHVESLRGTLLGDAVKDITAQAEAAVREGKKHLLVVVFDVLYLNGRDLVHEATPLRAREALLRSILEPIPTFVEVVPTEHVRADDEEALLASLGQVVRAKQEGLVLKRASSRYVPNGRGDWLKLKTQVSVRVIPAMEKTYMTTYTTPIMLIRSGMPGEG